MRRTLLILLSATACLAQGPLGRAVDDSIRQGLESTVWVNPPKPGQLPAGVTHHTYFSRSMRHDVGYCIYLPPDYAASGKRYPVIYNLHGAGGNELHSLEEAVVLDEGIRAGKLPPMVLVLPNGGKTTMYKDSYDGKFMGETNIVRELIPHIDATYRTIATREGRCIEGFSMGGRGSTRLALKYPDMFCSLFNQAGNVMHIAGLYDPAHPDTYPNFYLGPDKSRYIDNDPFLLLQKNLDRIKGKLRIRPPAHSARISPGADGGRRGSYLYGDRGSGAQPQRDVFTLSGDLVRLPRGVAAPQFAAHYQWTVIASHLPLWT
jgi:enterochelin esterase-like enzyme